MSMSEPTLDDVFLRQTGRSLRDGGDAGVGDTGDGADHVASPADDEKEPAR